MKIKQRQWVLWYLLAGLLWVVLVILPVTKAAFAGPVILPYIKRDEYFIRTLPYKVDNIPQVTPEEYSKGYRILRCAAHPAGLKCKEFGEDLREYAAWELGVDYYQVEIINITRYTPAKQLKQLKHSNLDDILQIKVKIR